MIALGRATTGLVIRSLAAREVALLARLHAASPAASRRTTRRTFVRNAALGSSAVVLAELTAGFVWFWWPNKTGEFGSELAVDAADVPPVKGTPFRYAPGKFFLARNEDGLLAMYWTCPHLGCTVPWVGPPDSPQAYQCPCHGSMYNFNGERTGGPAPRPLDLMKVTVNADGSVAVDTGAINTRSEYRPKQAVPYPA